MIQLEQRCILELVDKLEVPDMLGRSDISDRWAVVQKGNLKAAHQKTLDLACNSLHFALNSI